MRFQRICTYHKKISIIRKGVFKSCKLRYRQYNGLQNKDKKTNDGHKIIPRKLRLSSTNPTKVGWILEKANIYINYISVHQTISENNVNFLYTNVYIYIYIFFFHSTKH